MLITSVGDESVTKACREPLLAGSAAVPGSLVKVPLPLRSVACHGGLSVLEYVSKPEFSTGLGVAHAGPELEALVDELVELDAG